MDRLLESSSMSATSVLTFIAGLVVLYVSMHPPCLAASSKGNPSNESLLVTTKTATLICYHLWLHGLARYPGPLFAKACSVPNWYHAAKGDRHEWLHELHDRYGSAVRFAPNSVSFDTAEAVESIYKTSKANLTKSDWYQCVRDSAGGFESTFTARQKSRHAIKRRLLSHAFSERALRDYEPRICSLVAIWLDCLEAEAKKGAASLDLGDWCNYLIFDILGDLAYGSSFGLTKDTEDRSIVGLIPKATGGWYSLGYHPWSRLLRYILFKTRLGSFLGGQSFHDNVQFRTFCLSKLKERRQRTAAAAAAAVQGGATKREGSKDMFEHLLNGQDPQTGESYSIGDLACESVLLMVAGSQSTSGGLAATFFYLSHHPSKLAKLRAEIHAAFDSEECIRYTSGNKLLTLPYLRACINESLRLSPPTPGHLPREIGDGAGMTIGARWCPPSTIVGVSPYAIHRNKLYFSDPFAFSPERWLGQNKTSQIPAFAFTPFSAGTTGCIGQQLAMMELSIAIARTLWRFDLHASLGSTESPVEYRMKDRFVGQAIGPRVRLVLCPPS
ncbi:hypothetical protein QQS21_006564 [Conoideocrella luteorostrata]|uniref:Cytochrome P450 n=1 Tax=Conoideocrella luteorostrata TaxID=1105319 RepID=A0AAJ0CMD3_9HYPO|nr:hypothetical protein QQS21_006564 [Conoideocrella luteorostrata]